MTTYVVAYRLPLLSRAWNTVRVDADTSTEAVRMCTMEIPAAQIEDVWELGELESYPTETKLIEERFK